jgi:superfamily II RNA helicase
MFHVPLLFFFCVVSDEFHYINDVFRGSVWEETLMHLPANVQMVALSATLREPDKFLNWIATTRNRPGKLARRTDRHVPLHVGGVRYM